MGLMMRATPTTILQIRKRRPNLYKDIRACIQAGDLAPFLPLLSVQAAYDCISSTMGKYWMNSLDEFLKI